MDFSHDVGEMRAHRARLAALADRAESSQSQAQATAVENLPLYGIFCSPIVIPPLTVATLANVGAIGALGEFVNARAAAVGRTADLYEATEHANQASAEGMVTR